MFWSHHSEEERETDDSKLYELFSAWCGGRKQTQAKKNCLTEYTLK